MLIPFIDFRKKILDIFEGSHTGGLTWVMCLRGRSIADAFAAMLGCVPILQGWIESEGQGTRL